MSGRVPSQKYTLGTMSHLLDWAPVIINVVVYAIGQIIGHRQGRTIPPPHRPLLNAESVAALVEVIDSRFPKPPAAPNVDGPTL